MTCWLDSCWPAGVRGRGGEEVRRWITLVSHVESWSNGLLLMGGMAHVQVWAQHTGTLATSLPRTAVL